MRVAVLSLIEAAGAEPGALRGYLPIGGRSILRHQIGFALSLGCKRIIVMAEGISGELVALQHVSEAGGAQFHVIATARALVPLLQPEDDVFVLGDGLLAMPEALREMLEAGPVLLTLPVETGLPLGFERIDINNAFAAAMRFPGRIAAALADLPPEWNVQSALLRLAIQARVSHRSVPVSLLDDGRWSVIRSEDEAQLAERRWLRLHTSVAGQGAGSPGDMLAMATVRRLGPAMLHAGTRPALVGLAAGLIGLLGGGLGWLGSFAAGFVLLGLAWLVERIGSLLGQVERDSLLASGLAVRSVAVFHLLVDSGFVVLSAWRSELPSGPAVPVGAAAFAPLLLVILARIVPLALPGKSWSHWLEDRLLIGVFIAAASAFLPFDVSMGLAVVALAGTCLVALQIGQRAIESVSPNPRLTSRQ
ncbi:MAG: hypothetical protein V4521_09380 [Pseudomonadota bacterium]